MRPPFREDEERNRKMATTILDNVPRHFAATDQVRYASAYRRRLMDRSILDDILNGDPERVKGYLGSGKGISGPVRSW